MLDSEIYELLNESEENDIKTLITISIVYLSRVYDTNIKELIKDIKKIVKQLK
jgi:hypothetical protein